MGDTTYPKNAVSHESNIKQKRVKEFVVYINEMKNKSEDMIRNIDWSPSTINTHLLIHNI